LRNKDVIAVDSRGFLARGSRSMTDSNGEAGNRARIFPREKRRAQDPWGDGGCRVRRFAARFLKSVFSW